MSLKLGVVIDPTSQKNYVSFDGDPVLRCGFCVSSTFLTVVE